MAIIEAMDLLNVGDKLRAINQQIKTTLQEIGGQPVGSVPRDIAITVQNLEREYNKARELYTTVYRAVHGEVPVGLGLVLAAVPALAWASLIALMVVIFRYSATLEKAMLAWRENLRVRQGSILPPVQDSIGEWFSDNALWVAVGAFGLILILRK